jgi:hypothetical protein
MASVKPRRKAKASSLMEFGYASTSEGFGGFVLQTIGEWFADLGPKPDADGLMVWASKPSVTGLTGLGLKIREWWIGGHVMASQSLCRDEATSRRRRIYWIDKEKLGLIYP